MNKATRAKIALNELDSKLLNPRRNKEGISSIRRCISTWQQPYSSSHINCNKKQISLWLELVTVNSNHSMSHTPHAQSTKRIHSFSLPSALVLVWASPNDHFELRDSTNTKHHV